MHVRQLCPDLRQTHLSWTGLMAEGAAELFKTRNLLTLLVRAPLFGYWDDPVHVREQARAALIILCGLLPPRCESEFAILARGVAVPASVVVEHIFGYFPLARVGCDHSIQSRHGLSGRGLRLRLHLWKAERNHDQQGHAANRYP